MLINGEEFRKFDGNMMSIGEVLVQWIGGYAHVTFEDTGIDVFWDGSNSIQVSVQKSLRKQLCGLCGFYNAKKSDDLRRRDNSKASNVDNFALSWLHGSGNTIDKCKPTGSDRSCAKNMQKNANKTCSALNNAIFGSCHSKINPQQYITNCIKDFCDCNRNDRKVCACKVIASYARACAQAGVNVENWISQSKCSKFLH